MKAYIVQGRKLIEPFNELPRDCFIGNKALATLQKETFLRFGIEPLFIETSQQIDDLDDCIVVDDNVYFTPELLVEFITRSRQQKRNTVCALKRGITTCRTLSGIQNVTDRGTYVEYNLRYLGGERFREKDYVPIIIDSDQCCEYFTIPKHICDNEKYLIPLTDKFVIQIDHWVNLWAANIITALMMATKLQRKSKIELFLIALKTCSLSRWKILSRMNIIGRNCDIHPTAYIEGSVVGEGVKIGAGVVIRQSIIGRGAFIGNGVTIEESVVGEKSTILHGHILYSVLCSGVFSVAQMISASFVGRNSFVASGATLTDFRLDGKNVTILKEGLQINSGNKFLGCCLGNDVYLGSGCVVAPGRMIPNGMHISLEKDRIIVDCNPDRITNGFRLAQH